MNSNEERDLKRMEVLEAVLKRAESTGEQRLEAVSEMLDIVAKYDALSVQRLCRLLTLDTLKVLQEVVAKHPTNAEEKKARDEAKQAFAYYEKLLFPPEKLPNG
jgi:hypothetical protein